MHDWIRWYCAKHLLMDLLHIHYLSCHYTHTSVILGPQVNSPSRMHRDMGLLRSTVTTPLTCTLVSPQQAELADKPENVLATADSFAIANKWTLPTLEVKAQRCMVAR